MWSTLLLLMLAHTPQRFIFFEALLKNNDVEFSESCLHTSPGNPCSQNAEIRSGGFQNVICLPLHHDDF
jgi:hypothetical protein